ncbi:MAG: hypothetical protein H0V76_11730 [Blastocatellia bacterium]|nr:hypothetical protein [Blastocatellia bacterium]
MRKLKLSLIVLLLPGVLLSWHGSAAGQAPTGELDASRELIGALEVENAALRRRLDTERATVSLLEELNATRRSENDALRAAFAAKNETITAKDEVIAAQERLIDGLKARRTSVWKRIGDVAIGAAIGAVLR